MQTSLVGTYIGSYQLSDLLGRGGMGVVYLASHPTIKKQVAFKILKPEYTEKKEIVHRFFQEARSVNQIRHEHIVDISDCGSTPSGLFYIQMEYLEGEPLHHLLQCEGALPPARLGHIGLQLCSALSAAHEKGIIHRDLKSDNIFLIERSGKKDFVKLLDFGIAKVMEEHEADKPSTKDGAVLGTPLYMSPEQAKGLSVDHQSDIYSLGVLLYQMATNSHPFMHKSPYTVASMHISATPPRPTEKNPAVPLGVEAVILRCLQKEKDQRYASVYELALDLGLACGIDATPYFFRSEQEKLQSTKSSYSALTLNGPLTPVPKRKKSPAYLAVSALLGLVALFWFFGRAPSEALVISTSQTKLKEAPVVQPASVPVVSAPLTPASVPVASAPASQPIRTAKNKNQPPKAAEPTKTQKPAQTEQPKTTTPFEAKHHTLDPFK